MFAWNLPGSANSSAMTISGNMPPNGDDEPASVDELLNGRRLESRDLILIGVLIP